MFFLTLLRLRVGLPEQDTAFRFGISQAFVSRMLVTWISFLARELSCLMYWPDRKDVQRFYPQCFQKYKYVIGIIGCNEGILQKPSVVKTSAGTYPLYRNVMVVVCQIDLLLRIVIYLINYNMVTI